MKKVLSMPPLERPPIKRSPASTKVAHQDKPKTPKLTTGNRTVLFLMLLVVISALVVMGLLMVLSASPVVSVGTSGSAWSKFNQQAQSVAVGVVAMVILMCVDYRRWRSFAIAVAIFAMALLVMVLVTDFGVTSSGATRWLNLGPLSFQPSELAKFALILFVADVLSRPDRDIRRASTTLVPVSIITGLYGYLCLKQPHLGNAMILAVVALAMLFWAGTKMRYLLAAATLSTTIVVLLVFNTPWRRERLLTALDPWSDPQGSSYQLLHSLHSITAGGISGMGLGDGLAKWGFVPYAHSDFIYAVVAEELGIFGAALVLLLFFAVGICGFMGAWRAQDRFGTLLAVGITTWLFAQACLNIGSVMGLIPTVGVTLPMLSHGGTSTIVVMAASGILLNITRQNR